MSRRWIAALAFVALAGCRSAQPGWGSAAAPAPDAERWDRRACRQDGYPERLDANALARARHEDLRARQRGGASPSAAARLLDERTAFEARCAAWRAEDASPRIATTKL